MNAGIRLQRDWRWNGRPLRVRVTEVLGGWKISWERWDTRGLWREWRAYVSGPELDLVIRQYREYAAGWRGREW